MLTQLQAIDELKHSIRIHMLILGGPSQQLCAFLLKIIDLIEDDKSERRLEETSRLAFSIIEVVGIHTQQAIDSRYEVSRKKEHIMPESVRRKSDSILVAIGEARSTDDMVLAKNHILIAVASALDSLSTFTGSTYPTLFDSTGNRLNNHQPLSDAAEPLK